MRHAERRAVVGVLLVAPHLLVLADDFGEDRLRRVGVRDVEAGDLAAARAAAGAELEPTFAQVVEHGDALGDAHRVVHLRVHVEDPRPDVDVLGDRGEVAEVHLVGRQVRVLGEEVVLGAPHVLPVVLVGHLDELDLVHERLVLRVGPDLLDALPRQVRLDEDAEFHVALPYPTKTGLIGLPVAPVTLSGDTESRPV